MRIRFIQVSSAIAAALALVGVQIVQAENESTFATGDIIAPAKCDLTGSIEQVTCCGRHGDFENPSGARFVMVMEMTADGVSCGCKKKC